MKNMVLPLLRSLFVRNASKKYGWGGGYVIKERFRDLHVVLSNNNEKSTYIVHSSKLITPRILLHKMEAVFAGVQYHIVVANFAENIQLRNEK